MPEAVRTRFRRTLRALLCFGLGCAASALLYAGVGLWNLALPVGLAVAAALLPLRD